MIDPDKALGPDVNPTFWSTSMRIFSRLVLRDYTTYLFLWISTSQILFCFQSVHSLPLWRTSVLLLCVMLYIKSWQGNSQSLKESLPSIISEYQSALVPRRSINGNILAAFELIHYMKWKKKSKMGYVALKIDTSKRMIILLGSLWSPLCDKWGLLLSLLVWSVFRLLRLPTLFLLMATL